jgi:glycosyltransferase involved in cell wall biosynthesis
MHKWWWKLYHAYEGWIHRRAQHNFFISREDRDFAIEAFHVKPDSCSVITYGVEEKKIKGEKTQLKKNIGIGAEQTMLLFNGTLDYKPNHDAVERIIDFIEPLLRKKIPDFVIIITGNRAPDDLLKKMNSASHLQFHGYVDDPDLYYQAADLFINPVSNDSGVKTKVIEAIANHCTTISTLSGASGIEIELCSNKIFTVPDGNFELFTDCIAERLQKPAGETPKMFFEAYNWKNITAKAAEKIRELSSR